MAYEIERKFLLNDMTFADVATKKLVIKQGYLSVDKDRTVRVRTLDDKGYITIKGKSTADGLTRFEWEKEISLCEAESLLQLSLPGEIIKTRYLVPFGRHTWEIDVFSGVNNGLVMAEVELSTESEEFAMPGFIGKEVTGDSRYYNSYLMQHPFTTW